MTTRQRDVQRLAQVGYSVRRAALELGLTPGQVIHAARSAGVRFNGSHYGPLSMATNNYGYSAEKRLTCQ